MNLVTPDRLHFIDGELLLYHCSLEEGGQTALGPALLISISMACQVPGSKVIICTDGMANVGLGNLDTLGSTEETYARTTAFFDQVSSMAAEKGYAFSTVMCQLERCLVISSL